MKTKKYKNIKVSIEEEFYREMQEAAEVTGIGEDFARVAIRRLVTEFKRYGQVMLGNPAIVSNSEARAFQRASDNAVVIHLTDLQREIMNTAVDKYKLTLEQAAAYGFFNFEFVIDPDAGDGWSAVQELLLAQNPDRAFQNRYEEEVTDLTKIAAELPQQRDAVA